MNPTGSSGPHLYEVGKLYHPGRTQWDERVTYEWRGEHELLMFASHPNEAEVWEARRGPVDIALVTRGQLIVIVFRVGLFYNWSDAPYSYHLTPAADQTLPPEVGLGERVGIYLHLVDADNGILLTFRWATMTAEFSRCLHKAIRHQAAMPFNRTQYERDIAQLYVEYPQSSDLLGIAIARCSLGRG